MQALAIEEAGDTEESQERPASTVHRVGEVPSEPQGPLCLRNCLWDFWEMFSHFLSSAPWGSFTPQAGAECGDSWGCFPYLWGAVGQGKLGDHGLHLPLLSPWLAEWPWKGPLLGPNHFSACHPSFSGTANLLSQQEPP